MTNWFCCRRNHFTIPCTASYPSTSDLPLTSIQIELFVSWAHTQQLFHDNDVILNRQDEMRTDTDRIEMAHATIWRCLKTLVFGDRFLAAAFRRAAHARLSEVMIGDKTGWMCPRSGIVQYAYDKFPPHRPFLQQLADEYRHAWCTLKSARR